MKYWHFLMVKMVNLSAISDTIVCFVYNRRDSRNIYISNLRR